MLDASLIQQLQQYLQRLQNPVKIVATLDESEHSTALRTLLQTLVELSAMLSLELRFGHDGRAPSFTLAKPGDTPRVGFAGMPLGHEFSSLVLALLQVGGHPVKASAEQIAAARALQTELSFETYVSLECQNCPDVVQALNALAALNPRVRHTMIDGAMFQDEVEARAIMTVPTVLLNGEPFGQGRMGLQEILAKLSGQSPERERERLDAQSPFDVLVIGAGPAGAAAALYAARKGVRTGIVADRFGGQVLDTLAIENFVSVNETEGPKLARALESHVRQYPVDVMEGQRAQRLVPGELIGIELASGASLRARSVIVASGARWRELGVPGEREYRGRGVAYCPHCDGPLFKGKPVAVIGGGNSGVEAAIDLAGIAAHVTLLEFDAALRADAVLTDRLRSLANVTVITHGETLRVEGDGTRLTALVYRDRRSGDEQRLTLAGIFVQIGLLPNTEWLRGTLNLSPRGEIDTDRRGRTSMPGVFAAGDCTSTPFKQIVIAMGDGASAALGAFEHLIRSPLAVAA